MLYHDQERFGMLNQFPTETAVEVVTEGDTAGTQPLFGKQMNASIQMCFSFLQPFGKKLPIGFRLCDSSSFSSPGKDLKLRPHYSHA